MGEVPVSQVYPGNCREPQDVARYAGPVIDARCCAPIPTAYAPPSAARGESVTLVDDLVAADQARRDTIAAYEELRAEQKEPGQAAGPRLGRRSATRLLARTKELADLVKKADAAQSEVALAFDRCCGRSATWCSPTSRPAARTTTSCSRPSATPRDFAAEGFTPRDHLELGALLGAIDVERGAKVSGSRFYYLTGVGAELELALVNLAMSMAIGNGFTAMIPPALVKPAAMEGTGFLGQAAKDVYHLRDRRPLPGGHRRGAAGGVPLRRDPRRRRACRDGTPGSARATGARPGRTARTPGASSGCTGSTRSRCSSSARPRRPTPSTSGCWPGRRSSSTRWRCRSRCSSWPSGDLGLSAARKYDCYGWLPTQDRYREITSTSNCTEFQARRLNIRARFPGGTGPVATLNGTLCAMTRTIIMMLENHQQADGSVRVPAALRPFLGGREVLTPR